MVFNANFIQNLTANNSPVYNYITRSSFTVYGGVQQLMLYNTVSFFPDPTAYTHNLNRLKAGRTAGSGPFEKAKDRAVPSFGERERRKGNTQGRYTFRQKDRTGRENTKY